MEGQIIKIPFPYVQKEGFKIRPAVILKEATGHMICAAISSNGTIRKGDVYIKDWKKAGLMLPSKVKIMLVTSFSAHNNEMPISRIGFLSCEDFKKVIKKYEKTWGGTTINEPAGLAI